MKFHLFFEQSGTFKNEFIKLGYTAFDYDILNDFGETDYIVDLFENINLAYDGFSSIFDNILSDDLIFAFFPCTRFENQILLWFRGESNSQKKWSLEKKLDYCLKLHNDLDLFYSIITKLVIVCLRKNIKLIIENPYSSQHYLINYWPIKPTIIDTNRRLSCDYYNKPTQYYFINFSPSNNLIFEAYDYLDKKRISFVGDKVERSLISPHYANRFIREFIL